MRTLLSVWLHRSRALSTAVPLVVLLGSASPTPAQSGAPTGTRGVLPQPLAWQPRPELTRRGSHAMAYDPVRKRVVMFGGSHLEPRDDTWEWDGQRWELRHPATKPPARGSHAMAFDPVRKTVLLFGGETFTLNGSGGPQLFSDLWEWDGRDWSAVPYMAGPRARMDHAMAVDPRRGRVVLFGGAVGSGLFPTVASDTWEWDGQRWHSMTPPNSPSARYWSAMAYHANSQRIVLFSGGLLGNPSQDTWAWDGLDWTRISSGTGPVARLGGVMAEDPNTGDLILYGGGTAAGVGTSETWAFDGASWRQLQASMPPPYQVPALVADPDRKRLVLVGWPSSSQAGETWTWDGQDWARAYAPEIPSGVFTPVYVSSRDHVLLVGPGDGPSGPLPIETWTLSESGYTKVVSPTAPSPRDGFSLAYHEASGLVLLFGGQGPRGVGLNDTWLWDGSTWTEYTTGARPPTLCYGLTYDRARERIVLGCSQGVLWEWEPVAGWVERKPTFRPAGHLWDGLAYDPVRARVVAFVRGGGPLAETWEWDGSQWFHPTPRTSPPAQCCPLMAYDHALRGVVIAGFPLAGVEPEPSWLWDGRDWRALPASLPEQASSSRPRSVAYDVGRQKLLAFYMFLDYFPSVWDLELRTLTASPSEPRPGELVSLRAAIPSEAGRPFVLGLSGGTAPGIPLRQSPAGIELLPLEPDALLLASLGLPLARVLDGEGRASFALPLPNDPGLSGLHLHAAGFTLEPGLRVGWITNMQSMLVVP